MILASNNQKLVDRMEAIHFGKGGVETFGGPPVFKKKKKSQPPTFGSMNYLIRKTENERIYKDNQILFAKLKGTKAHLPKSDHDEHYAKTRKVIKTLSKESQLKFLAAMSFGGLGNESKLGRSPSLSGLASERSRT